MHVDSEAIEDIDYEPRRRRLLVRFTSGERYAYADVPGQVHRSFLKAESKGRFFHQHIDGQYRYERLKD